MTLLAACGRADWITLDGGGILLVLVAWGLGACFAFAGLVLLIAASFPQPKRGRRQLLSQAAFCFALAPLHALVLPFVLDAFPRDTHDALANWSIVWAPALAAGWGWLVYGLGDTSR